MEGRRGQRGYVSRAALAARADMSEILVKDVFDTILACMEEGIEVRIAGFGTFRPVERRAGAPVLSPVINDGVPTPRRPGLTMRFKLSMTLRKKWTGVSIPRPLPDLKLARIENEKDHRAAKRERWLKAKKEGENL